MPNGKLCQIVYPTRKHVLFLNKRFSVYFIYINNFSENSQSSAVPEPTMPFAILSLRNALKLTRFYSKYLSVSSATLEESSCNDVDELNWHQIKDNNYCNPSGPVAKSAVDHILSSIYAAYSYVSLRLGDYVTALEMAQELLKVEKISDAHKYVTHAHKSHFLLCYKRIL